MRKKTFYKYRNLTRKIYNIELALSIGGTNIGGCTIPAPTDYILQKHIKLRLRYDKFKDSPEYNKMLWDTVYYSKTS